MKRQQTISRFFAPKCNPASSSNGGDFEKDPRNCKQNLSSPSSVADPSPPSAKPHVGAATVAWPPHDLPRRPSSIRSVKQDFTFSSSKKRPVDDTSEELLSSGGREGDVDSTAIPCHKKRTLSNRPLSDGATQGTGTEDIKNSKTDSELLSQPNPCDFNNIVKEQREVDTGVSNCNVLDKASKELETRLHKPGGDTFDSLNGCPSGEPDMSLQISANPVRVRKKPSVQSINQVSVPASNPVRHKKFVEKLLARSDQNGVVQEAWYGKPSLGKVTYTPLEQQVVELKARYPDVVLLIEVGYKFRFFGGDAETAAHVLGIFAHYDHNFLTASIPTFRLHVHVRRLVESGYKVGVVRQTETAAIKAHGANKTGPFTRNLSALYTRATLEAAEDLGGETQGRVGRLSTYLMCIAEQPLLHGWSPNKARVGLPGRMGEMAAAEEGGRFGLKGDRKASSFDTQFGVVAVETATGDVMYGDFKDTVMRTELEARLLTCSPAELLLATPLASATEKLLMEFAGPASEVRVERMPRDCFKDGGAVAEVVAFYGSQSNQNSSVVGTASEGEMSPKEEKVDEGLQAVMAMPDIVVQALALALRYLKQFGLEKVLCLGASFRPFAGQNEMSLSPNTLRQLEILKNNANGSDKGSLLWLLDHTHTAFGARLLRHWVTHPLQDHMLIAARLDAVAEIAESMGGIGASQEEGTFSGSGWGGGAVGALIHGRTDAGGKGGRHGLLASLLMSLGRLPDVERGITRIFLGTATAAEFVSVIQALVNATKQLSRLQLHQEVDRELIVEKGTRGIRSPLLGRLLATASSSAVSGHAEQLLSALNTDAAAAGDKLNLFLCTGGRFSEVARCRAAIKEAERRLDDLLPSLRKLLRLPNMDYMSVAGTTHLVEVPVAQRVPANWMKVNTTKKMNRYHPPDVLEGLDSLALAKEELNAACRRAWDVFLAEFASHYVDFRAAVQALAALDCLHSLAIVSRNQGYTRPEFVGESEPSQLMIEAGRHPVLESTLQDGFVPNDTFLHAQGQICQIITGPNMGGKSCYIRQVALIAIMAQVGSYIPALSAKLHVLDAVYTRMGASDSIQNGSSTFFEELSEASMILLRATSRSLVIMDELGRGTSTHDGVAIAYATLQHLLKETRCLTLFVTHYPEIVELKGEFPTQVGPCYVSYLAEEPLAHVIAGKNASSSLSPLGEHQHVKAEETLSRLEGPEPEFMKETKQNITFLYKLVAGVASRSFGLHVARLAQIPEACVLQAATLAAKLEKEVGVRGNAQIVARSLSMSSEKISPCKETQDTDTGMDCTERGPVSQEGAPSPESPSGRLACNSDMHVLDRLDAGGERDCRHSTSEVVKILSSISDALRHESLQDSLSALKALQDQAKLIL